MHFERDAIQELVYPKLNYKAQEFGQTVSFCDLRWGIDTSEMESDSGSKKVLDVCLDEIDRCQPPMVVILGYRYGWIPSEGLIKDASSEQDGFILLEMYNRMKELYQRITFGQYFDAEKLSEMYEKKMTSHEAFAPFMERKKAFSEVLEILRHMEAKYVDMIPKKLIMFFYDNCSLDYDFRMTEEIGKQKFMDETLRFLAMINTNFWKEEEPS